MNTFLQGFLDNDSFFGRFMTKFGIIIGANLMFVIFSIPGITIGACFVALYHVMFRTLRNGGVVNPFKEFLKGFKNNFKQATICWLAFLVIAYFLLWDVQVCKAAGGMIEMFKYGIFLILAIILIVFLYLLPTMSAFADSIPHLIRNAIYFAAKKPLKLLVILFFDVFPFVLTYTDLHMMPLYAFIWCMCGFGLQSMLGATLLLKEFKPYLDEISEEDYDYANPLEDEASMLEDLRELDGF